MKRRIFALTLAAMIIMVACVGDALAYSFSGRDETRVTTPNSVAQVSTAYGYPYVIQGTSATWANVLKHDDSGTSYYVASIAWYDGAGVPGSSSDVRIYYGETTSPSGATSGQESLGWQDIYNWHNYDYMGYGYGPSYIFDNQYYVGT